jgi:DNA-binding protein
MPITLFKMRDANTVYVGNKPPMAYVMALITAFKSSGTENVVLKARGRAISRAVDVAEIARNRYLNNLSAGKIEIGTEQLPTEGGGTRGVSTISITLRRGGEAPEKVVPPPEPEAETPSEIEAPPEVEIRPEAQPEVKPLSVDKALPEAKAPTRKDASLSDLKSVGKKTEERLREAGYKSPRSIARAKASTLSGKTGLSEKVASRLIEASKELLK